MVIKVKVHSAKVPDQDGLRFLLESARTEFPRLKHLWLDAGYEGRGKKWGEETLGLSVEVVRKSTSTYPLAESLHGASYMPASSMCW